MQVDHSHLLSGEDSEHHTKLFVGYSEHSGEWCISFKPFSLLQGQGLGIWALWPSGHTPHHHSLYLSLQSSPAICTSLYPLCIECPGPLLASPLSSLLLSPSSLCLPQDKSMNPKYWDQEGTLFRSWQMEKMAG